MRRKTSKGSFNQHLHEARTQRHWSQKEVADRIGTTANNVSRWELGQTMPGPYFRTRLCALFGKSAQELGLVEQTVQPTGASERETAKVGSTSASAVEELMLWTVPYSRNLHFTGRDEVLEQLAEHLSPVGGGASTNTRCAALTQPQAIKGLGDIGKTQIAVEYAYRAHEQGCYTHTIWINAANEETIMTSFVTLAELLPDFSAKNEKDQRKLVAAIIRWLEQCRDRWLLIFDNADDLPLIQEYLPQLGQGSILLTTRATAVGSLAVALEVEKMGLMEGTHFLLRRAQRQCTSDEASNEATNVVIALDGFPLALDQAGAYIEETGCSFEEYLQLYQKHRHNLLARRGSQTTNYPDSVATTWSLSFQKVEQANPTAAELLQLCAFLAPDHIPEELFRDGMTYWPPALQQATADFFPFNQLLEELLKFSLVKRHVEDRMLSIHRLIQVVIMDSMGVEEQRLWAKRVVQAINKTFPQTVTATTWSLCRRYLPQAQLCTLWIQEHAFVFEEAASLLFRTASYLYDHALYPQAELLFQRAKHIWEQALGAEHPDVAASLYRLAIIYSQQAKYEQAEAFHLRALHLREQALGAEHPDVAASLYRLAIIYSQQEKILQAEPLFQHALQIWEQKLGPDHLDLAGVLDGLAILYAQQEKVLQAEPLFQRALHIRKQVLGPEHPDIAASLTNLANFSLDQGKYEQAESLSLQAVRIWEQALKLHHPYVAYPLEVLAEVYAKQGKYTQAESLYQQVLLIREQAFEPLHPVTAETLHAFATFQETRGNLPEAVSLYRRALTIRAQVLGADHPQTTKTRERLCAILQAMGKTEETVR